MKRFLIISILIFLINCRSTKQAVFPEFTVQNPQRIKDYEKELKLFTRIDEFRTKNIDFIAYKSYSVGSIRLIEKDPNSHDNCIPDYPIYLIWSENNKEYIQMFDNCGSFFPLELDNSDITNFVNENFEIIKSEKIKFYQTNKSTVSMIDHSTFKQFLISKSDFETYNDFDIYNLSSKSGSLNINAKYNNNLKIVSLNNLIEKKIKNLRFIKSK
ncbi:hypothetical protein GCM10022217_02310 [Chryseobacterium ginsenosidimutans]|uniref:hypothetical protein n=1 Tax=Chryseobacterium ginsenosidimutans TaxID=687846 RepID=UPI0031CE56F9